MPLIRGDTHGRKRIQTTIKSDLNRYHYNEEAISIWSVLPGKRITPYTSGSLGRYDFCHGPDYVSHTR